jgi:hypothetical protein
MHRRRAMRVLTINIGAMCMDGGSVYLEATDTAGQSWQISLDWSIAAKHNGNTTLSINGTKLKAAGVEEVEWIESLRRAEIAGADRPAQTPPTLQNRVVLAPDAKTYLDAMDNGPRSALLALREDLLQKLQSPQHRNQLPASMISLKSKPWLP